MAEKASGGVQSVERVFELLELITDAGGDVTLSELCGSCACINDFLANGEVAIQTITEHKLRVLMSSIWFEDRTPCWRRQVKCVINPRMAISLLGDRSRRHHPNKPTHNKESP